MTYQLPPLNGLRAFEAAARLLSFKEAAKELFVTPGAVSQQIKGLEDYLEAPLFLRGSRSITLTEAGRTLQPVLREAFLQISDVTRILLERDRSGPMTISVLPSFAARWLVPRLGRFREKHPDIDVRISATTHLIDFNREDVDLAVRLGLGRWPGLRCDWLMQEDIFPVCSPRLLEGPIPLNDPTDLNAHTLLHDDNPETWRIWLKASGVTGVDASHGVTFNDASMMVQAAERGQGVAMGRRALVEDDLRDGRLVKPFDIVVPFEFAYYVVYPEAYAERVKVAAFREWIIAEAGTEPPGGRP